MFDFVLHRKIFFIISGILLLLSIVFLLIFGLKPGIDFTGGSLIQVLYTDERPSVNTIIQKLQTFDLGEVKVQATGENGYIIRLKDIDENTHHKILAILDNPQELRFESMGPVIGKELRIKAQKAIALSLLAIIIYIAWAFRKISKIAKKRESWRYGSGALLALFHDVLILLGFFSLMGYFLGTEINTAFIVAILIVLGYSVNDTIVVYDRIRENLLTHSYEAMEDAINVSLNETMIRSLTTSLTTLFVLLVIYLFGGASIQNFVLAMMVGVGVGTYSSIAIASQFLLLRRTR